jgi:hypothetical protein
VHIIQQIKKQTHLSLNHCFLLLGVNFFLHAFELDGTSELAFAGVAGGCDAPSPAMAIASLLQFKHEVRK